MQATDGRELTLEMAPLAFLEVNGTTFSLLGRALLCTLVGNKGV